MMHKRNLTLTALVWAAIITCAFLLFPRLYHGTLGLFYWPAIALAVTAAHFLTGNGHSPSNVIGWSSFAVYSIFYLVVFLVVYVILLEIYLLRGVLHHLDDAIQYLTPVEAKRGPDEPVSDGTDTQKALETVGQALAEVEAKRRKHFLLKSIDLLDLSEAPHILAARAITGAGQSRPVKGLLKKLRSKLAAKIGPTKAAFLMAKLQEQSKTIVSQHPPTSGRKE
jgi:hypothetical protein